MKKRKLHFEKFRILKMNNLHQIYGGTGDPTVNTDPNHTVNTGPNHTVDPDTDTIDTNSNPIRPLSSQPCKGINTTDTVTTTG